MLVLTVTLLLATTAETAQPAIRVPLGKPVMIDGKLDGNGWKDSAKTELPGLATLYVKQSDEYIWLAVKLKANDAALDLYLSPLDGSIYDLHASAKLGERRLQSGAGRNGRGGIMKDGSPTYPESTLSRGALFCRRMFASTKFVVRVFPARIGG